MATKQLGFDERGATYLSTDTVLSTDVGFPDAGSPGVGTSTFNLRAKRRLTLASTGSGTSAFGLTRAGGLKQLAILSTGTGTSSFSMAQGALISSPADAISPGGLLGCGIARAEVWTRGGGARVMDLPDITSASWERVLGDTSQGSVTINGRSVSSDPACRSALADIRAWKHELHIYRDDAREWLGPITEIEEQGDALELKARDLSAWYDRRFVHLTHIYGGEGVDMGDTDTTTIFTALVTDAMSPDPSPAITLDLGAVAGVLASGSYTPASFKTVGPLIRDLAKGSIDWFMQRRTLFYTGAGVSLPSVPGGGQDSTSISIAQPGLEASTAGWSITGTNWTYVRDTGVFRSGVASGKAAISPTNPNTQGVLSVALNQLVVGKSYTVNVWLRGGTIAANYWAYHPQLYITVGSVRGANVAWVIAGAPTTWLMTSVTFTATSATQSCQIYSRGSIYSFYVDDVQLVLNNPDAPPLVPAATPPVNIVLTDEALAQPAKVKHSGLDQTTRSVVVPQQAGGDVAVYGEAPEPAWALNTTGPGLTDEQEEFGLLEVATTSALADGSGVQAQASQRAALLADPPVLIDSLVLSPQAGVSMSELLPGALLYVRLDRPLFPVRAVLMIRQVTVKTSPSGGEQVELKLEPTGYAWS